MIRSFHRTVFQCTHIPCRGYTGLQLLTQIIADITTLKWRGLVSGLMTMPFIINAFLGSNTAAKVLDGAGWRWGCMCDMP